MFSHDAHIVMSLLNSNIRNNHISKCKTRCRNGDRIFFKSSCWISTIFRYYSLSSCDNLHITLPFCHFYPFVRAYVRAFVVNSIGVSIFYGYYRSWFKFYRDNDVGFKEVLIVQYQVYAFLYFRDILYICLIS